MRERTAEPSRPLPGLARGAPAWVPAAAAIAAAGVAGSVRAHGRARAASLALAGAGAGLCAFFRDPSRTPAAGRFVAAADGVVSAVETGPDGRVRISTFMGLQNVHVNRAPIAGRVRTRQHNPGGYKPAFSAASDTNERMAWIIDSALGEVELAQIAGLVARRIVPYARPGDTVGKGERIGMIRFGSRVDVTLPAGHAAAVAVGQRVRAGRTRLDRP